MQNTVHLSTDATVCPQKPTSYMCPTERTDTSKCSKDQPPYLPVFSKKKTYKWTLQPSQEMELLQEQENTENPEQPDSLIFQIAWKN